MKKILCTILTILLAISPLCVNAATSYEKALSRITPFKLFEEKEPDDIVTRGEAVQALIKILVRAELPNDGMTSRFADVDADSDVAPYINYACTLGYLSGIDGTHFAPDSPITAQQFVKVAVSALGYKLQAEKEGGYPDGYMSIALRLKLLEGVNYTRDSFSYAAAVRIIDNMMDTKTLEAVYDLDKYELSEDTLYEQMLRYGDMKSIKGIVTAVGKAALKGYAPLEKGEISVGGIKMDYSSADISILGKTVSVSVRDDDTTRIPLVESIYEEKVNEEVVIEARDLTKLDKNEAASYDEETRDKNNYSFSNPSVIYNGRLLSDAEEVQIAIPVGGSVRALSNNGDNIYDVMFIDEYESFIVERVQEVSHSIYLKDDKTFRGSRGIGLDFDDDDKEYEILSSNGEEVDFSSIGENSVISIWASKNSDAVKIVVCDKVLSGTITAKGDDSEFFLDDKEFSIYEPVRAEFLANYGLGQSGSFALNHADEIVGIVGELLRDGYYGYTIGFGYGKGLNAPAQIKVLNAGTKEKVTEKEDQTEKTYYNLLNGDVQIYEFADKVKYIDSAGNESRVNSSKLVQAEFYRAAVFFQLNSEGKIRTIEVYNVPEYETAKQPAYYEYYFNSIIGSFGGYAAKDAFYMGASTQLICVPTNSTPVDDDYGVDVSIYDDAKYTIMPVNINADTQIAECAILISEMDSTTVKPIKTTDEVAVIGKVRRVLNEDKGGYDYEFEILKGEKVEKAYLGEDSAIENVAKILRAGDLIKYNKKLSGEIGNIQYLESLSALGDSFFINREDSENEVVYAPVENIEVNRLDNELNEKVDYLTITVNGRSKPYTILREDGAMVYTYEKDSGEVRAATSDEIIAGVSNVYMLVDNRNPLVVVNVVE